VSADEVLRQIQEDLLRNPEREMSLKGSAEYARLARRTRVEEKASAAAIAICICI
jgi:hypothetical protein